MAELGTEFVYSGTDINANVNLVPNVFQREGAFFGNLGLCVTSGMVFAVNNEDNTLVAKNVNEDTIGPKRMPINVVTGTNPIAVACGCKPIRIYVASSRCNALNEHDPVTGELIRTIPLPGQPTSITYVEKTDELYVTIVPDITNFGGTAVDNDFTGSVAIVRCPRKPVVDAVKSDEDRITFVYEKVVEEGVIEIFLDYSDSNFTGNRISSAVTARGVRSVSPNIWETNDGAFNLLWSVEGGNVFFKRSERGYFDTDPLKDKIIRFADGTPLTDIKFPSVTHQGRPGKWYDGIILTYWKDNTLFFARGEQRLDANDEVTYELQPPGVLQRGVEVPYRAMLTLLKNGKWAVKFWLSNETKTSTAFITQHSVDAGATWFDIPNDWSEPLECMASDTWDSNRAWDQQHLMVWVDEGAQTSRVRVKRLHFNDVDQLEEFGTAQTINEDTAPEQFMGNYFDHRENGIHFLGYLTRSDELVVMRSITGSSTFDIPVRGRA